MDEELYAALMGEIPEEDPAAIKALAARLRRQSLIGNLSAMSGDRALSPWGMKAMAAADATGDDIGRRRETQRELKRRAQADADEKAYRAASLKQAAALAAAQDRLRRDLQASDNATRLAIAGLNQSTDLEIAGMKGEKGRNLTQGLIKDLEGKGATRSNLRNSIAKFDPEFVQMWGAGPQSRLPISLAAVGLGTQKAKDAAQWMAEFKRGFTLENRNNMFGATLTPSEQKAWEEAQLINPGMDPEEITKRLTALQTAADESLKRKTRGLVAEGFRPQSIAEFSGLGEDDYNNYLGGVEADPRSGPASRGGARVHSRNPLHEMTDEQLMELLQRSNVQDELE